MHVRAGIRLAEQAVDRIRRAENDGGVEQWDDRPATQVRGRVGPPHEQNDEREKPERSDGVRGQVDGLRQRVRPVDCLKRVLGASLHAVAERPAAGQRVGEHEHHDPHARCRRGEEEDESALERRAEPVAREAEKEIDEVGDEGGGRETTNRERQWSRGRGECRRGIEKAGHGHERPEPAVRAVPPGVRTNGHIGGDGQPFENSGHLGVLHDGAVPAADDRRRCREGSEGPDACDGDGG